VPCRAACWLALLICLGVQAVATEPAGVWLDVPFVKQSPDGCGAASVAMVMQYWNRQQSVQLDAHSDPDYILQVLLSEKVHGIYASKMKQYFEANGFRAFAFQGEWPDLKQHLDKGRPLIVALKPSSISATLHYVVVTGLQAETNVVLINDPAQRKLLKQDRAGFEREWKAARNWTLLAVPVRGDH